MNKKNPQSTKTCSNNARRAQTQNVPRVDSAPFFSKKKTKSGTKLIVNKIFVRRAA